jgi:hypothetical protein
VASVKVRDNGAARLLVGVKQANFRVKIGVLGSEAHEGTPGLTIAQLFEIHELGLGVPERSVLRAWAEASEDQIMADLRQAYHKILTLKLTPDRAAAIIGARFVGSIQKFISDGRVQPPLAQSTIDKKGSSVPLIDTGQLRSAITFAVEKLLG